MKLVRGNCCRSADARGLEHFDLRTGGEECAPIRLHSLTRPPFSWSRHHTVQKNDLETKAPDSTTKSPRNLTLLVSPNP